ncbi:MAG: DegT/DnrJ/EryC1/StrS family aminotransferase [Gammaproteobacteria bacterium]
MVDQRATKISLTRSINRIEFVPGWPTLPPQSLLRGAAAAPAFPFNAPRIRWIYRATNAIYHLFTALPLRADDVVLVPDYHSGNEVWAMRAAGANLVFYPIGRDRRPDMDALKRLFREHKPRVLYSIHYLGWPQPLAELQTLCADGNTLLIEDCALSMFGHYEGRPLGSIGDYSIYCLYKTFAAPNGGLLVENGEPLPALDSLRFRACGALSTAGRTAELVVEWARSLAPTAGAALQRAKHRVGRALTSLRVERELIGNIGFDAAAVDLAISPLSQRLARGIDAKAIRRRRRENFSYLRANLPARVAVLADDIGEDACPLFLPLRVHDKEGLSTALNERGITALEFWNYGDAEARRYEGEDSRYMRQHVLGLPIHQQVTRAQLDYMADSMSDLVKFC